MTKLIKTNLLKNNNTSDIAKVTASTKDYCDYRYKQVFKDMNSFKEIFGSIFYTSLLLFTLHGYLLLKLTGGLIFWPLWMLQHFLLKRKVIHEVLADNKTIDELNQKAKEIEANSKE